MSSYHCSLSQINPQGEPSPANLWLLAQLREMQFRTFTPNPFRSIGEFAAHFDLALNRKSFWRLTEYKLGHITGLPNSWGRIVATDGIMCYIFQGVEGKLYHGHVSSFVIDEAEYSIGDNTKKVKSGEAKSRKRKESFLDGLTD